MSATNTLWRSGAISNALKATIIQAEHWPIVTYGAAAWTLNILTGNIKASEMQSYRKAPSTEHIALTTKFWKG